jgi:proprotein convertase subtilisin/kexin type 5
MMPNKGKCLTYSECEGWGLYRDIIKRTCHRCLPNCKSCKSQNTCEVCEEEYFLSASGVCERCSPDPTTKCLKCLDDCQCTLCEAGMYLKKNDDGSIVCDPCTAPGQFKIEKERRCVNCAPNCNICKDAMNCAECIVTANNPLNTFILDMRTNRCVIIEECDACGIPPLVKYENDKKCGRCSENCEICCDPDNCEVCAKGYFLMFNNKCAPCIANCNVCNDFSTCVTCSDGYTLYRSNTQCKLTTESFLVGTFEKVEATCLREDCLPFCELCTVDDSCLRCAIGYYLDLQCGADDDLERYTCIPCNLPGQIRLANSDKCGRCGTGDPSNCHECCPDEPGYCLRCAPDFFVYQGFCYKTCPVATFEDKTQSVWKCTPCKNPGCAECSGPSDNQCLCCFDEGSKYFLQSDIDECVTDSVCNCDTHAIIDIYCHPRIPNCADQPSQFICGKCVSNYFVNTENTCTKCSDNCDRCADVGKCDTCKTGYYLYKGATCTPCSAKGFVKDESTKACFDCPDDCDECCTPSSCTKCSDLYYLFGEDESVTCLPCLTSTGFVKIGSSNGSGTCKKCGDNCLDCTDCTGEDNCQKCDEGFVISDGCCMPCPQGCAVCTPEGRCLTCKLGKFVLPGTPDTCIACDQPGEYRYYEGNLDTCDMIDRVCSKCSTNCDICYDHERCAQCKNGFLVDRTQALPTEKCIDTDECCLGIHFQDSEACYVCDNNCAECDSRNTCKSCSAGYYLNQAKKCSACTGGCTECTSATSCTKCDDHDIYFKYSSDNIFESCSNTCDNGFTQCDFPYQCYKCPSGCATCEFDSNKNIKCLTCTSPLVLKLGRCVQCDTGYSESSGVCVLCSTSCTSCPVGHYLSGGACVACGANCKTCTSDICLNCFDGYYQFIPTCDECSRCNQPGNYLSPITGLCTASCLNNCKVCASATKCSVCEIDFYLNTVDETCIKCTEAAQFVDGVKCHNPCTENCQVCQSTSKCLLCKEGYFKDAAGTCSKCLTGCLVCDDQFTCKQCECQHFLLQPMGTKCVHIPTAASIPVSHYLIGLPGK